MKTNYYGTVAMMREFASVLENNASSKIVNIVSIAAYSLLLRLPVTWHLKRLFFSATLSARIEFAKKGVIVHMVNPCAINIDMNKGSDWDAFCKNDTG